MTLEFFGLKLRLDIQVNEYTRTVLVEVAAHKNGSRRWALVRYHYDTGEYEVV
jgi:hypothetical protein